MKTIFYILPLLIFTTSCAVLNPNPNRKNLSPQPLQLKEFSTDYCSEWPDGGAVDPKLWASCCFTHDLNYWLGGTEKERYESDYELKVCVRNTSDSLNGFLMYTGVRLGGYPGEASYAWGYGWSQDREYFNLSSEEKLKAKKLLLRSEYNKNENEKKLLDKFIEKKLLIR